MAGRRLCTEHEAISTGFRGAESARRRDVLRETIRAFEESEPPERYHQLAKTNLDRWRVQSGAAPSHQRVEVFPGDWGEVTRSLTATYGECFAVLNMANAAGKYTMRQTLGPWVAVEHVEVPLPPPTHTDTASSHTL